MSECLHKVFVGNVEPKRGSCYCKDCCKTMYEIELEAKLSASESARNVLMNRMKKAEKVCEAAEQAMSSLYVSKSHKILVDALTTWQKEAAK